MYRPQGEHIIGRPISTICHAAAATHRDEGHLACLVASYTDSNSAKTHTKESSSLAGQTHSGGGGGGEG